MTEQGYSSESIEDTQASSCEERLVHLDNVRNLKRVLKPGGSIALAIQPRIQNASEATSQATGKFLLKLLNEAESLR
jgi:hypothetical protein